MWLNKGKGRDKDKENPAGYIVFALTGKDNAFVCKVTPYCALARLY